uniref:Wsv277-like protein n=1 Tax=Sicyonia whispovirus TaxID=2984283 RepID=A0A9C7BN66_9VIRU|nr:MAG: wsv277-like protein [Sicyonia whispovirus]
MKDSDEDSQGPLNIVIYPETEEPAQEAAQEPAHEAAQDPAQDPAKDPAQDPAQVTAQEAAQEAGACSTGQKMASGATGKKRPLDCDADVDADADTDAEAEAKAVAPEELANSPTPSAAMEDGGCERPAKRSRHADYRESSDASEIARAAKPYKYWRFTATPEQTEEARTLAASDARIEETLVLPEGGLLMRIVKGLSHSNVAELFSGLDGFSERLVENVDNRDFARVKNAKKPRTCRYLAPPSVTTFYVSFEIVGDTLRQRVENLLGVIEDSAARKLEECQDAGLRRVCIADIGLNSGCLAVKRNLTKTEMVVAWAAFDAKARAKAQGCEAKAGAKKETEVKMETKTKTETEREAKIESETETEMVAETEMETESETETETETETLNESETPENSLPGEVVERAEKEGAKRVAEETLSLSLKCEGRLRNFETMTREYFKAKARAFTLSRNKMFWFCAQPFYLDGEQAPLPLNSLKDQGLTAYIMFKDGSGIFQFSRDRTLDNHDIACRVLRARHKALCFQVNLKDTKTILADRKHSIDCSYGEFIQRSSWNNASRASNYFKYRRADGSGMSEDDVVGLVTMPAVFSTVNFLVGTSHGVARSRRKIKPADISPAAVRRAEDLKRSLRRKIKRGPRTRFGKRAAVQIRAETAERAKKLATPEEDAPSEVEEGVVFEAITLKQYNYLREATPFNSLCGLRKSTNSPIKSFSELPHTSFSFRGLQRSALLELSKRRKVGLLLARQDERGDSFSGVIKTLSSIKPRNLSPGAGDGLHLLSKKLYKTEREHVISSPVHYKFENGSMKRFTGRDESGQEAYAVAETAPEELL